VTDGLNEKSFLRSVEVARLSGVSTDTLRHYERKGLIPHPRRSANGYREYPLATVDRVLLVQRAIAVGFTIDELAKILKQRDKGGTPCREVRALAQAKMTGIEKQLHELTALHEELRTILQDWDERLVNTSAGARAGLLEALVKSGGKVRTRSLNARAGVKRLQSKKESLR
jgi:DNA-binding transcriptional MerR regulator